MAFAEYFIHRWTMHRKCWWLPGSVFNEHSIEHHHKERNDINIDLSVFNHFLIGSPLIIATILLGWWACLAGLIATFFFHSYAWTKLHRAIHELEDNWVGRSWFFKYFKKHHEDHHKRPGRNFAVVYIFTDYIFGTSYK